MSNDPTAVRLSLSAGLASVLVATLLVALKLWALAETGALSIAASLADSALDLMMSLGAAAAIIYAARPADEDHAFGHTSAEDLAALAQSTIILVSSAVIAWTAIHHLAWWTRDHGPTNLSNGLALCHHCHRLVHDHRWTVHLDPTTATATWTTPNGTVTTTRPHTPPRPPPTTTHPRP